MVSKRKARSKHKQSPEDGKKQRDQDTIRQINAALDADPVRDTAYIVENVVCTLISIFSQLVGKNISTCSQQDLYTQPQEYDWTQVNRALLRKIAVVRGLVNNEVNLIA